MFDKGCPSTDSTWQLAKGVGGLVVKSIVAITQLEIRVSMGPGFDSRPTQVILFRLFCTFLLAFHRN